ncbi:hypothetical protein H8E77_19585 [bacterium]|nr:hypothetical protein [bacterium]
MATHQVTLALPEPVYRLAEQTAAAAKRSVEVLLVEALTATLPPISDLPEKIATEVADFVGLEDDVLLTIATETLSPTQQQQLTRLLSKNSEGSLTKKEQTTLNQLMDEYWRVTLRKAQAQAILAQRRKVWGPKGVQSEC